MTTNEPELQSHLLRRMQEAAVPGVSLSIVRKGEMVLATGGVRDAASQAPGNGETTMLVSD